MWGPQLPLVIILDRVSRNASMHPHSAEAGAGVHVRRLAGNAALDDSLLATLDRNLATLSMVQINVALDETWDLTAQSWNPKLRLILATASKRSRPGLWKYRYIWILFVWCGWGGCITGFEHRRSSWGGWRPHGCFPEASCSR